MITEFELSLLERKNDSDEKKAIEVSKRSEEVSKVPEVSKEPEEEIPIHEGQSGYEVDYKIKEVLGGIKISGELFFTVVWEETNTQEMLPVRLVQKKYPIDYIKFMESRLTFKNSD